MIDYHDRVRGVPVHKENIIPWVEVAVGVGDAESVAMSCYIDLASRETLELLIRDGMKFELPERTSATCYHTSPILK